MAWLAGWDKRIELKIEDYAGDIGASVTWFPVTVFLTSGQGKEVFVELTTDAEYLKVAFTKADGTTELYGEKELFTYSTSEYPPVQSDTYVKSTTKDTTNFWAYYATDPTKSLVGSYVYNSWLSASGGITNQRFHIDLGTAKVAIKIYYENVHSSGTITNIGVNNFTFWGSNTAGDFAELTYAENGTWVQIAPENLSQTYFDEHSEADEVDPKYITVTNATPYRYYAFKFVDNHGNGYHMGVRRIELQASEAIFHVSRDGWVINANTSIFMYYDKDHADNDTYIGAINTAAGAAVWDGNFVSVFHMADASGGIIDSTDNSKDGSEGGNPTYVQTGKIGNCILFDGTGDYFDIPNDFGIWTTQDHTIEAWVKGTSFADNDMMISLLGESNVKLQVAGSDIAATKYGTDSNFHNVTLKTSAPTGEWHYYAASYDHGGAGTVGYYDDTSPDTDAYSGDIASSAVDNYIGGQSGQTRWFDGNLDEIRFSDNIRSSAWTKGTYNSGMDSLFTYGSEEEAEVEVEVNAIMFGANF